MTPPRAQALPAPFKWRVIMASKEYECNFCHYVYSEEQGEETEGVVPGTQWEDLPEDFKCPHCRTKKKNFTERTL